MNLKKKHELLKAISLYTSAIYWGRDFASAYFNRGLIYLRIGKLEEASTDFGKVISMEPENDSAYNCEAITSSRLGDYKNKPEYFEKAVKNYTKAIKLNSNKAEYYYSRGITFQRLEKDEESLRDFEKAIELGYEDALIYQGLGYHYFRIKDFDKAIYTYTKGIEIDSEMWELYRWRGIVYSLSGIYDRAITDFTSDIDLCPEDPIAFLNRCEAYFLYEDYEKSFEDAESAFRFGSSLDYIEILEQAIESYKKGNLKKAKTGLKKYFKKTNKV